MSKIETCYALAEQAYFHEWTTQKCKLCAQQTLLRSALVGCGSHTNLVVISAKVELTVTYSSDDRGKTEDSQQDSCWTDSGDNQSAFKQ